jgi:diguanylate cyclase (GGDEF)-like protein
VSEQVVEQPIRPRVLLLGDAAARPAGLERALTRAGFQLVEREDPEACPEADAILITLGDIGAEPPADLLPGSACGPGSKAPRVVIVSNSNPDAPAAALALGAADALASPVHLPELCARLYARIRERQQPTLPPGSEPASAGSNGRTGSGVPATEDVREVLDQKVQEEFERARRYSLSFSLILLGVDELQGMSDRLGGDAAERLRDEVARALRRELRLPDFVTPYGSEEFAIVLPETGPAGARQSVLRVRERLMTLPFEGDPRLEPTRFSAGIVTYPHPAANQTDDLFAMAEAALMRGKAQAGERIGVAM